MLRCAYWLPICAGLLCFGVAGGHHLRRLRYQQRYLATPDTALPALSPSSRDLDPAGRIEIPKIGLKAVIVNGDDERALSVGVGHIAGTAAPGEPGNVGLAAHRDTFFRRLAELQEGDPIRVNTWRGTRTYRVGSTRIIEPDDLSVLAASARPSLTLVTCYPFRYVGDAPQRYIVRASESPAAEPEAIPAKPSPLGRRALPPGLAPAGNSSAPPQASPSRRRWTSPFRKAARLFARAGG